MEQRSKKVGVRSEGNKEIVLETKYVLKKVKTKQRKWVREER